MVVQKKKKVIEWKTSCNRKKKFKKKVVEVKVETPAVVETKTPEAQLVEQVKESTNKLASQVVEESKKVASHWKVKQ